MKVLNICMNAAFTDGYSYQDNLLSKYQKLLGHDVTVLTTTKTRDKDGNTINIYPEDKILETGVQLIRIEDPGKLLNFLGIYPGLQKRIRNVKPDIIFVHGLCSHVPGAAIRYKKQYRDTILVADNHQDCINTKISGVPFGIQLRYMKLRWSRWINWFSRVYGTTSWRTAFANVFFGIPLNKLDNLVMGVDTEQLPDDFLAVRHSVRNQLELSENQFVLITGGKLYKDRRTLELMKAFSEIKRSDAVLIIFGKPMPDIQNDFQQLLSADRRIKYLGYLNSDEIKEYLIASDFGVFPGPHSVLWEEAIGCGLPCLFRKYEEKDHTDVCGNCVRVSDGTADELYACLDRILSDRPYFEAMRDQAKLAAKDFDYYAIAKKSLECAETARGE